jgi:spoIIIJ-associated protein
MTPDPSFPAASEPLLDRYGPQIESLLNDIIRHGQFRLSYVIHRSDPSNEPAESPEIMVEFSGPDSGLLVEAQGELLNAIEYIVLRAVRLEEGLFAKIAFDCEGWRRLRVEELKLMAQVAADRVQETGDPFPLGPMNPRERRIVHLVLHSRTEVRTESEGRGPERRVVIYPASSSTRRH